MELKEFIKTTLEEIAEGVSEAKPKFRELGGEINPRIQSRMHGGNTTDSITKVEFEVSLTDNSSSSTNKGIGVLLNIVSVGTNKTDENKIESLTKIKFSVPIEMP